MSMKVHQTGEQAPGTPLMASAEQETSAVPTSVTSKLKDARDIYHLYSVNDH